MELTVNGNRNRCFIVILALAMSFSTTWAWGSSNTFTYQGELRKEGVRFDGLAMLTFRLFDAETGGTEIGSGVSFPNEDIVEGRFTVPLDFGAGAFTGAARWLEIEVEGNTLSPRQRLTSTPFAQFAFAVPNVLTNNTNSAVGVDALVSITSGSANTATGAI